jgi:DNA ligase 4
MAVIIFDVVYLNQVPLTRYALKERRNVLHRIINPVARRFEIHTWTAAKTVEEIENALRDIVTKGYNAS